MTCVHTFADGNQLEAYEDGGYSAESLTTVINDIDSSVFVYFDGIYISEEYTLDHITLEDVNGDYFNISLIGFNVSTYDIVINKCVTESDIIQLEYIYEAAKEFIVMLRELKHIYKYVVGYNNNVSSSIKKHCATIIDNNRYNRLCYMSDHETVDVTQEEREIVIKEFVDKLVIYNPATIKTNSARTV